MIIRFLANHFCKAHLSKDKILYYRKNVHESQILLRYAKCETPEKTTKMYLKRYNTFFKHPNFKHFIDNGPTPTAYDFDYYADHLNRLFLSDKRKVYKPKLNKYIYDLEEELTFSSKKKLKPVHLLVKMINSYFYKTGLDIISNCVVEHIGDTEITFAILF
jgi:hypothetical protein